MIEKELEEQETGIVIMTHGPLAEAIILSASMLFGEFKNIHPLTLEEGEDPNHYFERLLLTVEKAGENPLFFLDFVGGTPFNTLIRYARDKDVSAVSGVNIPMLLEAGHQREFLSGNELLKAVLEAGTEGMIDLTEMITEAKEEG